MIARSIICVAGYHLSCAGKGLPDDGAVGGVEPHLVAGLDAEGVKEGVDVPQRGVHTVAADGVGVTLGLLEDGFLSHVVGPDAAIAQVEALRGRETVNLLVLAALLRGAESIVGDAQTTLVGDVLTQGQVAIGVLILYNNDLVKLCSELFGSLLESLAVLLGPPVGHVERREVAGWRRGSRFRWWWGCSRHSQSEVSCPTRHGQRVCPSCQGCGGSHTD